MTFSKPTDSDLLNRFTHHPITSGEQIEKYATIREQILETAILIRDLTPVSPEQSRAFNALDEAMFLANAAIARHES